MAERVREYPSGWRWLARVAIAWGVGVSGLGTGWLLWDGAVRQQCDASIAELRARGEPVRWIELDLPPLPDVENGANLLRAASAAVNAQGMRPLARQLRGMPARWVTVVGGSPSFGVLPNLRSLSTTLSGEAVREHVAGNELEAVELIRDLDGIAECLTQPPGTLIAGLIGMIYDAHTMTALEAIAPDVRIGDGGLSPKQVRELMADLVRGEDMLVNGVANGWRFGRVGATNGYLTSAQPSPLRPAVASQLRKLWTWEDEVSGNTRRLQETASLPVGELERAFGVLPQFSYRSELSQTVLRRRAAVMTLAVQLYRHERGRFPQSAEELVPGYLCEIPADPRRMDGARLGYLLLESGARPVIYSRGPSDAEVAAIARGAPATRTLMGLKPAPASTVLYQDATNWPATQPSAVK